MFPVEFAVTESGGHQESKEKLRKEKVGEGSLSYKKDKWKKEKEI